VQWKTETQLQAEYADVLGAEADTALLRVAQDLDAGLHATEPPAVLWSVPWRLPEAAGTREGPPGGWMPQADQDRPLLPPPALAAGKPLGSDPSVSGGNRKWRMHTKLYAAFTLVAACAILLATGITLAGPNTSSIAYLGPPAPVVSTASEQPLGGFHRVSTFVRRGGKPDLIFLAAQASARKIDIERWPLVKALSQFGRLTGIKAVDKHCVPVKGGGAAGLESCTIPTYDLSHARYSSPYLAFDSKDLVRRVGSKNRAFQPMSPIEKMLFDRYVRSRTKPLCPKLDKSGNIILVGGQLLSYTCTSFADYVNEAINNQTSRALPLIAVGDYLQTVSQIMITGDFVDTIPLTPTPGAKFPLLEDEHMASFDADRKGMLTGQAPFLLSGLVRNVNSEANVITALICHATKGQPKSVCTRPTIKQILKSVR